MSGWHVPHHYKLGEHVLWRGVDLVCTRDHYAGDAAEHPWDPGDGWDAAKAATLWTPNGPEETAKLIELLLAREPDRLSSVLSKAGR